jgi:hypothetical protein
MYLTVAKYYLKHEKECLNSLKYDYKRILIKMSNYIIILIRMNNYIKNTNEQWRRQVSEFGGAFGGQTHILGGKIEFLKRYCYTAPGGRIS